MDRYYAILARSIAATGRDDVETRQAVYAHVRRELDRLIATADPKMPASEQIAHQSALEQAIARTEDEFAARGAAVTPQHTAAQANQANRNQANRNQATRKPPARDPAARKPATGQRSGGIPAFLTRRPKPQAVSQKPTAQADLWGDEAAARGGLAGLLRSRTGIFAGAALGAALALLVGAYFILSGLNAPTVPSFDAIAARLKDKGAATLFLGAGIERVGSGRGTRVSSTGGVFSPGAVRVSSRADEAETTTRTSAARIRLSPAIRQALANKTLGVTVVARAAPGDPSPRFALAIIDNNQQTTGWQEFELGATFRPYTIEYAFAAQGGRKPLIAIWADVAGKGRAVEINEISLQTSE